MLIIRLQNDERRGSALEAEQLLGVSARNLSAVGFADGSLVKPLSGLDQVLVRIID